MDGGRLALNKNGTPETAWRREAKIYTVAPGSFEKEIGEGRNCTIETVIDKNVYARTENGIVIVKKPDAINKSLGKGSLPLVKSAVYSNYLYYS